jgi:hypothetical protein
LLLVFGTSFFWIPSANAVPPELMVRNVTIICANPAGETHTANTGWDADNSFFNGKGDIARLFCEGGFIGQWTTYISDNYTGVGRYYNGIAPSPTPEPTPSASPSPDSQTVVSETVTVVDTPTAVETPTVVQPTPTPSETSSPVSDTNTAVTQEPESTTVPSETTTVIETPTAVVTPEPPVIPEPAPIVAPQPPVVREEPVPTPEPPAPAPEPEPEPIPEPLPEPDPAPEVEPEPPIVEPEPPAPEPEPPVVEPEPPVVEPEPEVIPEPAPEVAPEPPAVEPEPPMVEAEPPMVAEENATEEEKAIVADAIIEAAGGEPVTAAAIADAGLTYADLPPETPVEVRQDENGNEVVITAEVAAALLVLENPAELINAIFTDPTQVLLAIGSIGADMSDEERHESEQIIVASVIAGQAAVTAAGAAGAYRRKP